jgi:predicted nucleic acid-binding protein
MPSQKRSRRRAKIASEYPLNEPKLLYLDASALVKLVRPEPETKALIAALDPEAKLVSSEIAEVEVLRALRRWDGDSAVALGRSKLESVRLLPINQGVRHAACDLGPAELRTLDAIHVATAMQLGDLLESIYAYDLRLIEAACDAGLRVLAPTG